jgi:hypothetical protein
MRQGVKFDSPDAATTCENPLFGFPGTQSHTTVIALILWVARLASPHLSTSGERHRYFGTLPENRNPLIVSKRE